MVEFEKQTIAERVHAHRQNYKSHIKVGKKTHPLGQWNISSRLAGTGKNNTA